jgi:hypothetical protein
MKKSLLLLCFSLAYSLSQAQLNNTVFEDRLPVKPAYSSNLYLEINTLGFVKNNEYFNKILEGYTLFGYQLNPKLVYFPSPNVRVEAGVFAWKDFGNNRYSSLAPTFTIKYQKESLAFVFGTLEGSLSHRLIEPLYDFERVITNRLENGAQFLYNHKYLYLDAWINWESMIYPGSTHQEVLTAGLSSTVKVLDSEAWKVSFPLQFLTWHRGGQINTSNLPASTLVNGTAGISIHRSLSPAGFFRHIRTDNYVVYHKDLIANISPFQEGTGSYINMTLGTAWLDIMGSYWHGNRYVSSRGGPLYQSVSSISDNEGYTEPQRELFILRLLHNSKLTEQLVLSTRLEPIYDFNSKEIEFSFGLYLNYKPKFLLKKGILTDD